MAIALTPKVHVTLAVVRKLIAGEMPMHGVRMLRHLIESSTTLPNRVTMLVPDEPFPKRKRKGTFVSYIPNEPDGPSLGTEQSRTNASPLAHSSSANEGPLKPSMTAKEMGTVVFTHLQFMGTPWENPQPPDELFGRQFKRAISRQVHLTYKQWRVARFVVCGLDDKEISQHLKISVRMVKSHLQAVRRKARVARRTQLVRWYLGL
jgi:DNA-binding CsgD family transcriptional regulator